MNDFHQELATGESEGIEFKRSTSLLKEAIQTLCAFANHKGVSFTLVSQMMGRALGKQSRTTR